MRLIVEKLTDRLGDSYLASEDVTINLAISSDYLFVETYDGLYKIPIEAVRGLLTVVEIFFLTKWQNKNFFHR